MPGLHAQHPDAEKIADFGLGRLSDADSRTIELHLAECEDCRKKLEDVQPDSLVSLLQASASDTQAGLDLAGPSADTDSSAPSPDSVPPLYKKLAQIIASKQTGKPRPTPPIEPRPDITAFEKPRFAIPRELEDHARYLVLEPLGSGGMGTVYRARHRVMERIVALKIVNPLLVTRPGAVERFTREVKAAAQLVHPNIVTAYDAEKLGDTHLLVMECVEGQTLAQAIEHRPELPVARACDYIRQTALGLQHALERGMVHRDIKPQNLMLTSRGEIKILDFGLARFVSEQAQSDGSTEHGSLMGSPDYMAPEQAHDAHSADARADIYSMGCTLYHLLAGQVPFPHSSLLAKLEAHRDQTAVPIQNLRTDVPAELARIVAKMMAKDPDQRFQSPSEVAEALRPFAQPQPESLGRLRDSASSAPRNRKPIFAMAIAACVLFLGAGYWLAQVVFRVETPGGTLIITTDDPDVQISVKANGREVELFFPREKKEIQLKVGEYTIELVKGKDGLKLSTNNFRIESGKGKTVTVEFVPAVVTRVEELLKKAQAALADNRHDEVRALAAQILKQDGKNAEAYYLRGETLNRQSKLVEGIRELDLALRLDPKHAQALSSRSFAFLNTSQYDAAIADCTTLLKLPPPKDLAATAHANRGGGRAWRGNFDAALADFEAALAVDNRWALWLYWRGMVHRRLGNAKQGEADRVRAIELDPSLAKQPFDRFDSVVAQPLPLPEWLDGREVLTVAQDGKAMFTTIGAALEKAKAGQVIRVLDKGPYRESISREAPDNVALVGEGATRIEIPKWTLWGPDPANKAKNVYQGFVLSSSVGLRLSGLEFICPEVPADASYAVAVELAMAGEIVVESCRIVRTPSYDRDAGPQEWKGEEFYALRLGRDDPGSRQFVRENHLEGTMDFVRGDAADIVMERNRVLAPRLAQGVRVNSSRAGKTVIRHNVIHAFNGICLGPQDPKGETKANYLIANNVLDVVNCPLFAWGDDKLAIPKAVRIHNNYVHSRSKTGFEVTAQEFPRINGAWQVSHNGFRDKPLEPADRPPHMWRWPFSKWDQIQDGPFLSDNRGELTTYLRIAGDSPLATAGIDGDLPKYIGAFPPGPAPKDGDWFTRLLAGAPVTPPVKEPAKKQVKIDPPKLPMPLAEWLQGRQIITVAQQKGLGDFATILDALKSVKPGQCIKLLDKGPYRERLEATLPEDVGLISEVGSVIELPEWKATGPDVADPKKTWYEGSVLTCGRGIRLAGLQFVGPRAPTSAAGTFRLVIRAAGDVVIESCQVLMNPRYPRAMPSDKDYPWGNHASVRVDHSPKDPGSLFAMNNYLEGTLAIWGNPTSTLVERNHILGWHFSGVLVAGSSLAGDIHVRHNVIHAWNCIGTHVANPPGVAVGRHVYANNFLDALREPILYLPWDGVKDRLWVPRNVRIQDNILLSKERGGIHVPAKDWAAVKEDWQVSHNCYLSEPTGIANGPIHDALPRQTADFVLKEPFLATDPKHANYLRIAADGRLATGGAGVNLASYIGPLPPGPAPKDGDWFSRLLAHAAPPVSR